MDGNGISSVLVVFYLGRHFRKCMRCVFLFVIDTLPCVLALFLSKVVVFAVLSLMKIRG
jgi:hypothetical protein